MKKLMIAAIAAASVGAVFAECGYDEKETPKDKAWAYQWKFSGKTTKAVGFECDCGNVVTRASASLKIQGWSLYCDPNCGDFEAMKADEVFWQTKPGKVAFIIEESGVTFEVANVIGKKAKDYEAAGTAKFVGIDGKTAYTLTFAGLGKYDVKNERVSSIKGNFAGTAAAPCLGGTYDKKTCKYGATTISKVWACDDLCPTTDADSVAYGKWSVKFNKGNAKKYGEKKLTVKKVAPNWVVDQINEYYK